MSEKKNDQPALMIQNSGLYDLLKFFAQIVLPALGTLYFALSQIWGLPAGEQVVGTIVAIDAFLGVVLGVSTVNYARSGQRYDGAIDILEADGVKTFSLELDGDPDELDQQSEVIFRINKMLPPKEDEHIL